MCVCARVCVRVCALSVKDQTNRQTETEREKQTERQREGHTICPTDRIMRMGNTPRAFQSAWTGSPSPSLLTTES